MVNKKSKTDPNIRIRVSKDTLQELMMWKAKSYKRSINELLTWWCFNLRKQEDERLRKQIAEQIKQEEIKSQEQSKKTEVNE